MKEIEELNYDFEWRNYDNLFAGIQRIEYQASNLLVSNSLIIVIATTLLKEQLIGIALITLIPPFISITLAVFCISLTVESLTANPEREKAFIVVDDSRPLQSQLQRVNKEIRKYSQTLIAKTKKKKILLIFSFVSFWMGVGFIVGMFIARLFLT